MNSSLAVITLLRLRGRVNEMTPEFSKATEKRGGEGTVLGFIENNSKMRDSSLRRLEVSYLQNFRADGQ